jgi:hypothetical protein
MKNPFETSIIEKPLSSYDFENSYPEKSCSNAIGLGGMNSAMILENP